MLLEQNVNSRSWKGQICDSSRSRERFSLQGPKLQLPYVGTASSNHNTVKQLLKSALPDRTLRFVGAGNG
jgi:hypothetical protein